MMTLWLLYLVICPWVLLMHRQEAQTKDVFCNTQFGQGLRLRREDLLHEVRLEEVEATERVHDPLGAVSDLPFGHLNAAWNRFIIGLDLDAELWSFRAKRATCGHDAQVWTGYALVRHGQPAEYFVVGGGWPP
jgi:hypothetical protein